MQEAAARKIDTAADPLLSAIKFAIAGNIIDYGAHHEFDIEESVEECIDRPLAIDEYGQLLHDLDSAGMILFLADNCGEILFDAALIRQLEKNVLLAVKERPIINDATLEDAVNYGLHDVCPVISNGTGCPGTPLNECSEEFQKAFADADIIISKGQGNFETLSESTAPIYFLLTVKCRVVAEHIGELTGIGILTGDTILMKNRCAKAYR